MRACYVVSIPFSYQHINIANGCHALQQRETNLINDVSLEALTIQFANA